MTPEYSQGEDEQAAPEPASWAQLTQKQRTDLKRACSDGIPPRTLNGRSTVAALESLGLVHLVESRKGRKLWRPTDTGRGLVASRGLIPTFLHRQSEYGYTHSHAQKLGCEPEVMDDAA